MHDSEPEMIHSLLKMVENKTQEILKDDKDFEIREAVRWAKTKGLLRKKTDIEIHNELLSKPWLKVNRTIRNNLDKQKEQQ
jgi:hypothetical protein|tara:strand:+ start:236 stop:478 length:243 start_codon:yes stop_codon:yes gene_type:complete